MGEYEKILTEMCQTLSDDPRGRVALRRADAAFAPLSREAGFRRTLYLILEQLSWTERCVFFLNAPWTFPGYLTRVRADK